MAFRVRWYLVNLVPHIDPARGPTLPADLNVYGRTETVALTPTVGVSRFTCDDIDHATVEASPNAARITLAGIVSDLPLAVQTRIAARISLADLSESLSSTLVRLVRVKRPNAALRDFLPDLYTHDGVVRDESLMVED